MVASAGHAASTMIKRRMEICKRKFFVRESGRRYGPVLIAHRARCAKYADQIPNRVDFRCDSRPAEAVHYPNECAGSAAWPLSVQQSDGRSARSGRGRHSERGEDVTAD